MKKKKWLIGLLAAAVLLLVAVFLIPALINFDRFAHELADELSEALDARVTIESGRLAILPDISFVVSGIHFPDGCGPIEKLAVSRARIDLEVLPLLFGEILVEEVHVHNPQVWLVRGGESRRPPVQAPTSSTIDENPFSFLELSDMLPSQLDISIHGGHLTLADRVVASPATIETWFCDTKIEIVGMSSTAPFNVNASCKMPHGSESGSIAAEFRIDPSVANYADRFLPFKFSGNISAEEIACLAFSAYFPDDVRQAELSGRCRLDLNIETRGAKWLSMDGEMGVNGLSLRHNLSGRDSGGVHNLDVSFSTALRPDGIWVKSAQIGIDDDKIGGQIIVVKREAGEVRMRYEFAAYKLPISTILDLLPASLLPPDTRDRIQGMTISGELRQLVMMFNGRLSDFCGDSSLVPKSLTAFCSVNKVKATGAFGTLGVKDLSGHASLRDGVLSLIAAGGAIAIPDEERSIEIAGPIVDIDVGSLSDLKKEAGEYAWADLLADCNPSRGSDPMVVVRAHSYNLSVADMHRIFAAMPLPASYEQIADELDQLRGQISGHCNVAVFLTGPSEPSVKARHHFPGGEFRYKPLNLRVEPVMVDANVSYQSARFITLFAFDKRSPLSCTVEIDKPYSDSASLSANATYTYRLGSLAPSSKEASPEAFAIDGPDAVVEATATGNYCELAIAIESDLTAHKIDYDEWFGKQAGERCKLRISASTIGSEELSIDEAQIEIGGVVVRGSGKVTGAGAPQWEMSAYLSETDVSELARFCPKAQGVEGDARLHGWLRAFSQGATSATSVPDGSPRLPNSCEAGLVLELDAQAMDDLFAADFLPDEARDVMSPFELTSGRARIEATAQFSLDDVRDATFSVAAELSDMRGAHAASPIGFSDVCGDLELTTTVLRIGRLSGVLGQSGFELKGEIKELLKAVLTGDKWRKVQGDLRLVIEPAISDLRALFGADFIEDLTYSKAPEIDLGAEGTLDDLTFDARITPRGAALTWGEVSLNPERADLSVLLTGRLQELSRLSAVESKIIIGASTLKLTGETADLTKPYLSLNLPEGSINMRDISQLVASLNPDIGAGALLFDVSYEAASDSPDGLRFISGLRARDVSFGLSGAERHVENLNLSFAASTSVITVENCSAKIGQSQVSFDVHADFDADVLRFSLQSPYLNTDDLVQAFSIEDPVPREAPATGSTIATTSFVDFRWIEDAPFLGHGALDASVSVSKFRIGEHDFGQMEFFAPIRDGVLEIEGFETEFCQGNLRLNLASRVLLECGLSLETDFRMKDARLEDVLELLGVKKVIATGAARISGSLQVCGADTDELLNFVTGRLKIKSRDGIIKKFGILSKIFSLLDILRIFKMDFRDFATTGTSYELLKCTATLDDGVLTTHNFVLIGSSMKMTGIGAVDLLDQIIEAKVGVFLLPVMGSVTQKIPFIGPMITQGNKALLPTYFRVYGDLADPKVKSLRVDKMEKATLEKLRGLLSVSQEKP